jgi:hypothetical protein
MRSSQTPGTSRAWPVIHSAGLAQARRSPRLLALLTAALAVGSLLTTLAAAPAAAQPPGPAPGVTLGAAVNSTHAPRLFYNSTSGTVWMRDLANPGSNPVFLGGHLIGGPGAVWVPPGELFAAGAFAVFGRGTDNRLWWTHQTSTGWSKWASLGGRLTSKPAAYATPTFGGQSSGLAVYVRGTDGAVWVRGFQPVTPGGLAFDDWRSIGGRLLPGTGPAAALTAGRISVAAVGTDRAVWIATFLYGSRGYVWHSLGGITTANPGIATPADGIVVAFARGTDNAAWYNEFVGQTTDVRPGWHLLGGKLTSGMTAIPTMVDRPQGPVCLFALGTDNQAWMRTGTWPNLHGWTRP